MRIPTCKTREEDDIRRTVSMTYKDLQGSGIPGAVLRIVQVNLQAGYPEYSGESLEVDGERFWASGKLTQ